MTRFATLIAGVSYLWSRPFEWLLAWHSFMWGLMISRGPMSMDGPAFAGLLEVMPEDRWGLLFLCSGLAHMGALIVNGRMGWTPWARAVVTWIIGGVWLWVALLFYDVDPWTTAVPTYLLVALSHWLGGLIACLEGGYQGARHGPH